MAVVRIKGLAELNAALRQYDKHLSKDLGEGLKKAAEPVVGSAREKVTRYRGASVGTIRARRSGVRVYVEQSKRKVTGRRGDFGALQMRTVLEPALEEKQSAVIHSVDELLDRWAAEFN